MRNSSAHQSPPLKISPEQTVREFVVNYPQLRQQLEKMAIDYCCGGQNSLGQAIQSVGLDWNEVETRLQQAWDCAQTEATPQDWNLATLSVLADHIVTTHHVFTREQLERLDGVLQKVQNAHSARHGQLLAAVRQVFDGLAQELFLHLQKEENVLFPAIKAIDAFIAGSGPRPEIHCGTVANPIRQMMLEHDSAGDALAELRRLARNYQLPDDACQTFTALYDGLEALEADLHEHIHLENNILFPKSLAQEETMGA
ncbi:MAG: iron-sulfur cluster repair di-iron protein [Desulfopila sp.]